MSSPRITLRTYGNYDPDVNSDDSAFVSREPSMTVQSQREEADINVIVKRFGVTGFMPSVPVPPTYGDFTGVSDYRSALEVLNAAKASFLKLPAEVRRRFGNDPAYFVEFCNDPENLPEMRKMGLAVPEKAQEPAPAAPEPVPAPEPPAPAVGRPGATSGAPVGRK